MLYVVHLLYNLSKARHGGPAHTWFLEITFVQMYVHAYVFVYVPGLLVTTHIK